MTWTQQEKKIATLAQSRNRLRTSKSKNDEDNEVNDDNNLITIMMKMTLLITIMKNTYKSI